MRIERVTCAALLLLSSCGDTVPPQALTACQTVSTQSAKTDILFVVDDSGSMAQRQANLATNFQAFASRLAMLPVKNDFQIGITTTSVHQLNGTVFSTTFPTNSGACNPVPNAGQPYPQGALVSVTGPNDPTQRLQSTTAPPRILPGSSPTLGQDFTSNAFVGVCGSGKEQGLDAARRAVREQIASGANAGFLRPGARLAVIVVSDDDDCSDPLMQGSNNEPPGCTSYPVQNYIDFFKSPIGGESKNVVVGAITGVDPATLQPAVCNGPGGPPEHAALRYKQFIDAFGALGVIDSICDASFAPTLEKIATLIGQEVPLAGAPADWRLLLVSLKKANGQVLKCQVGLSGDPNAANADVVYAPPTGTRPATITFQGSVCTLLPGDSVEIKVLCAG